MKKNTIYTIVAALVLCLACAENDIVGGDDVAHGVRMPIRLSVGNFVELQTRGTDSGLQDGTLAPGTHVGVFVMSERDYDSLRIGLVHHDMSYGYDNVECILNADGSLQPTWQTEMFYPVGRDMRIAVFAYAPYDRGMTREALFHPGDGIRVGADQSRDAAVLLNDVLLGTPVAGNPMRTPVIDHTASPYPSEPVSINMRHQCSRIVLDLTFQGPDTLQAEHRPFHADSILVYAEAVPMSAPLGHVLDSAMTNYAVADSIMQDTMLMAVYTDVHVEEGEDRQLHATGIVLPCPFPVEPSFCIVIISGHERKCIRRRVASPVFLDRGASLSFRATVDCCAEMSESLPLGGR